MTTTKSGGYSSYKKTPPKKDVKPQRDSGFFPLNFMLNIPLFVSMSLLMFSKSYQEPGTEAYYIYFSRTNSGFRKLLDEALIEATRLNFYRALDRLSETGWILQDPKEGDKGSVWRYDKRAPLALYNFFGVEPRPCMILKEGPTVEEARALDEELNGYSTIGQDYEMPDVLEDEVPQHRSACLSTPDDFVLELA